MLFLFVFLLCYLNLSWADGDIQKADVPRSFSMFLFLHMCHLCVFFLTLGSLCYLFVNENMSHKIKLLLSTFLGSRFVECRVNSLPK